MHLDKFIWDENNVEHIARHKVVPDEVEEAVTEKYRYLWQRWLGRYCVLGRTLAGRYLFIVFDYYSKERSAYVVTSRDMDDKERKLYKRKV